MNDQPAGYRIERDGGLATLVLDRPDVGNAVSPEMVDGLTAFFVAARESEKADQMRRSPLKPHPKRRPRSAS